MANDDDANNAEDAKDALTTVSEASSEIDLLSQLNDIQTTILTSSTTRGDSNSKKDLLKQLSMVMVQLVTDEDPLSEIPKSSSRKSIKTGRARRQGSAANCVRGDGNADIADFSIVSEASSETNVLSQLNDIQARILTAPSPRNKNSTKELVKQLAMVTVELLTAQSAAHETPKWASAGRKRHESPVPNTMNFTQNTTLEDDMVHRPTIEIACGDDAVSNLNSSPSMIATRVADGRKTRHSKLMEDKEFDNAGYLPDIVKDYRKEAEQMSTTLWSAFAYLVTFPVPDCLICKAGAGAKKAWREKVAIFFFFLFVSAIFVVMVSLVPVYICVESDQYFDATQIAQKGWNSIFGKVYHLQHFVDRHPGGATTLEKYFGIDTSRLFARLPPSKLPSFCLSERLNETVFNATNSLGLQDLNCSATEEELLRYGDSACHSSFSGTDEFNERLGRYKKGIFVIPGWDIGPRGLPDGSQVIIIDKAVYNVARYLDGLRYVLRRVGFFRCCSHYPLLTQVVIIPGKTP